MKRQQIARLAWFNGTNLYYLAFAYTVFFSFIRMTNFIPTIPSGLVNRSLYLVIVLLIFKIYALDQLNWKQLIACSLILLVSIISWRQSRSVDILIFVLFILGARDVNFRKLVRIFTILVGMMLIYTILISQIGIIKDAIYVRDHISRHSLGINYPTDLAAHFFYLILGYGYLRFGRLHWPDWIGMLIIGSLMFWVTNARTDFALTLLTIPVFAVAQRANRGFRLSRLTSSLYWMVTPLAFYCTVLLSYFYQSSNHWMSILNKILSSRLELSNQALSTYGISLFGKRVIEHAYGGSAGLKLFHATTSKYFYIDSSFIRLAVIYGLVISILIIAAMTYIGFQSTSVKGYCLAAIMLLVGIHCIIEQHILDISYNPFVIAVFAQNAYWCSEKKENIHSGGK